MADVGCRGCHPPFCKKHAVIKPWIIFRMCKDKCFKCDFCGYIYGPGHSQAGEKPWFITR